MKQVVVSVFLLFTVFFTHAKGIDKGILGEWRSIGIQYYHANGVKKGELVASTKDEWETYKFDDENNCSHYSENGEFDSLSIEMKYIIIGKRLIFYKEDEEDYHYDARVQLDAKGDKMELLRPGDGDYYYVELYERNK